MVALLISTAFASAPVRPEAPSPVKDECTHELPVTKGRGLAFVGENGKALCNGVMVPISVALDLAQTESWAKSIDGWYQIETAKLTHERDFYRIQLQHLQQPVPLKDRPAFWAASGIVVGISLSLGTVYGLTRIIP